MLHAEEGLWLVERGMLAVHPFSGSTSTSEVPAATAPSPSAGDDDGDDGRANPWGSRPETAEEEMGEHHQGGQEKEERAAFDFEARVGCSTGGVGGGQEEEEEEDGQGRADGSDGSSMAKKAPDHPQSSAPGQAILRKAGLSSKLNNCSGNKTRAGRFEDAPDSGGLARGEQKHGRRKRGGGCKRGRSGCDGSERGGGAAPPALFMSVEDLHGSILPRAGVPWECYRAYAELKRR